MCISAYFIFLIGNHLTLLHFLFNCASCSYFGLVTVISVDQYPKVASSHWCGTLMFRFPCNQIGLEGWGLRFLYGIFWEVHIRECMSECMYLALFQGLLRLQVLIACSMQKRREKACGISSHDLRHDRHMSSHLLSTAKWWMRLILHSLLATKMGQAPAESYIKYMKHIQAKSHDSKRLQSNEHEKTALFGVTRLISQPSFSA